MIRTIKNSAGKEIGEVVINKDRILIKNISKPEYVLIDEAINNSIGLPLQDELLIKLYDEYYLTIGEIAAIYDVTYSNINKRIKNKVTTNKAAGRRNSSYGKKFSETRRQNIASSLKGKKPKGYIRTPEIKQKISSSLKKYFQQHPQDPTPHRLNWANGKYDNVIFHRGVGGRFFSLKNNKFFVFRSLFELYYSLKLEEDLNVLQYEYEPFHIKCDNGMIYTPDFLINKVKVIELKSKRFIEHNKEIKSKFEYKKQQGEKFCNKNHLIYEVLYDEDLGYDSRRMKNFIRNNPEIVKKYQISFVQPDRVYGQ